MNNDTKKRLGRPPGLFDFNKLRLLRFLQVNPYQILDLVMLRACLAGSTDYEGVVLPDGWEPFSVCERQISRYLRALQTETLPDGNTRISIHRDLTYKPRRPDTKGLYRVVVCNDKRHINF